MSPEVPSWQLNVVATDEGITQATFTVDMYDPVTDPVEAMKHLAAVALWWCDTKPDLGLLPESK